MSALEVRLGPLTLRNPITTASGTFGYGLEFADFVDLAKIGGLCTKGLSLKPHAGNAPPRICETPAGMLNAIGLQNVGVEEFLAEKLPKLRDLRATVIANVWGDLEEDYVTIDWSQTSREIHNQVRAWSFAFQQEPEGPFAELDGERVKVKRTSLTDPGDGSPAHETGDGQIWILETEPAG